MTELDRKTLIALLRRAEREQHYDEMDTWYCVCGAGGPLPVLHDTDCPIAAALELLNESVDRAAEEPPPPPPPTMWDAIDVALDRFKMRDDIDPTPLGDLLVLFGFAHLCGSDIVGTLTEAGWKAPPSRWLDPDDSLPETFLQYTDRLARALSAGGPDLLVTSAAMLDPQDPDVEVRVWTQQPPLDRQSAPTVLARTDAIVIDEAPTPLAPVTGRDVGVTLTDATGRSTTIRASGVQFDWSAAQPARSPPLVPPPRPVVRAQWEGPARPVTILSRVHDEDTARRRPTLGSGDQADPDSPRNRAERRARRRGGR